MLIFKSYITEKEAQTENPYIHFMYDKSTGYFNSVTYMTSLTDKEFHKLTTFHLGLSVNYEISIDRILAYIRTDSILSIMGVIKRTHTGLKLEVGDKVRLVPKCDIKLQDLNAFVVKQYHGVNDNALVIKNLSNERELYVTVDGMVPGIGYVERIQDDE